MISYRCTINRCQLCSNSCYLLNILVCRFLIKWPHFLKDCALLTLVYILYRCRLIAKCVILFILCVLWLSGILLPLHTIKKCISYWLLNYKETCWCIEWKCKKLVINGFSIWVFKYLKSYDIQSDAYSLYSDTDCLSKNKCTGFQVISVKKIGIFKIGTRVICLRYRCADVWYLDLFLIIAHTYWLCLFAYNVLISRY